MFGRRSGKVMVTGIQDYRVGVNSVPALQAPKCARYTAFTLSPLESATDFYTLSRL